MSLREIAPIGPDDDPGPPTLADRRMASMLSQNARPHEAREDLRRESTDEAEDLLGRINALEFIDSVLGEDYELPSRIGDYEITGVLGRGGMGTVYKAFQPSLDREVALKVLAPRFSSDVTMRKRFRAEAKSTAAMHHQHIVPIYGYGESNGHLFFAMELVHGVSLDRHISIARRKGKGTMDWQEAARSFAGVADALALAHKRQILHRDVKPGNLLMHDDGTLALADFGLSKFLGEVSVNLTSVGGFLGTLHYASPEQARGHGLSPASDLYSLGVTLFETVTGKLPLYGDSTESMLHTLFNDEPLRLRDVQPRAPRDLDLVLDKLLQKDPRDRYQDAEALSLDLLRVSEGEPIRIRKRSLVSRLKRRIKRHPVYTAAIAAGLVVLVVTGLWYQTERENQAISRERLGRQHLENAGIAVAKEPGPADGPFGLLAALSGSTDADAEAESEFLRELAKAEKLLPDEAANLARFRLSYQGSAFVNEAEDSEDANPVVLLKNGNGSGAVAVITQRIADIMSNFNTHDLGVRMDLYNLYVARALARLSAAVAAPDQAENDLTLAAFIRSGAFLPRMLQELLKARQYLAFDGEAGDNVLRRIREFLENRTDEERRATAEVLLAFAGVARPIESHLMSFPMSYATRKVLATHALELLGREATEDFGYTGLEFKLAGYAAVVLGRLGDSPAMEGPIAAARDILENSVADTSPLKSWLFTFDRLTDAQSGPGDALDDEARVRGAIHYVRVVQRAFPIGEAESMLKDFAATPRITALLALGANLKNAVVPGSLQALAVELRARLLSWTAPPDQALAAATDWLRMDETDPAANLCKFEGLVRSEPKTEREGYQALIFGSNAVRGAVASEKNRIRARLVGRLEVQIEGMEPNAAHGGELGKLLVAFRSETKGG